MGRSQSILHGAITTVAMRWIDRLIGLVSMLILARLLVPDDFGLVAMAALAIGLADVLLNLGVEVVLVRKQDATQAHYNTAWTLRIMQMSLAAAVIAIGAHWIADYFHDTRLVPVLYALALSMFIAGLENIGIVNFQKEMRFQMEFKFRVTRRLIAFVVTIITAYVLHSYWALVIGTICLRLSGVVLSYLMHPMRPRLSLVHFKEIFGFSQWMLIGRIGEYLGNNLHRIIVGHGTDSTTMGHYTLADEVSAMPTEELLAPVNRVLFPAFSRVAHDLEKLKQTFLFTQAAQNLLALPAAVGLVLVANELVVVLLGENWTAAAPFVEVLAVGHAGGALIASAGSILIMLDRIRWGVYMEWMLTAVFVLLVYFLPIESSAMDIAWTRVAVFGALSVVLFYGALLIAFKPLSWLELLSTFLRPVLASSAMVFAVLQLSFPPEQHTAWVLVVKSATGALVYTASVALLWWMMGRPNGIETVILQKTSSLLARSQRPDHSA